MSLRIHVDGYPGCQVNERPKQFTLDDDIDTVAAVEAKRQYPDEA